MGDAMNHPENPESYDEVGYATKQTRQLWNFALFSPLLYLLIAWFLEWEELVDTRAGSKHPWDTPISHGIIAILSCGLGIMLVWMRIMRVSHIRLNLDNRVVALSRWTRNFYWMAMMSDSLGMLGLVYFALSGERWAVFVGGVAAYIGYLLSYPRASELDPLADRAA
jgi:hypothetical protein